MESEIFQIPEVFQKILDNSNQFDILPNIFKNNDFRSVQILARGTSDNAAHFLKYLIETKIGVPVGLTSLSSVTIYGTQLKFNNTLVIAISQSGQSSDLIKYSHAAKAGGGFLIAMTNDDLSPLATTADIHISLLAGKELAVAATKSYAAELLCSLLLVNCWLNQATQVQEIESIISQANSLITNSNLVAKAVVSVNSQDEIVVLGRGFSYPNAKEFALKIQETSKVSVQGLSIADYMHGPISALTSDTHLFLLAQKDTDLSFYPKFYTLTDHINKTAAISGYGIVSKASKIEYKFDNQRRAGYNVVKSYDKHMSICLMSKNDHSPLQFILTNGDSGGGLFIDGKLPGSNSCLIAEDGELDGSYGDLSGHTRIDLFEEWIEETKK